MTDQPSPTPARPDQLRLLHVDRRFRLDEHTKEVGRRGIARAREALRESAARGERGEAAPLVSLDLLPGDGHGPTHRPEVAPTSPARPADAA